MANRDFSLGATWKRLHANGYGATSWTHPDRIVDGNRRQRESFIALAAHPAAVMLHPTTANGAQELLVDCPGREVIDLIVTGYLLADPKQAKPVMSVLEEFRLLGGPVLTDSYLNQHRPLKWAGIWPIFDAEYAARLCFADDDETVLIRHAIAPSRYKSTRDIFGRESRAALDPIGSHILPLDGEWKGGTLLDTPRDKLPELLAADVAAVITAVERARWEGRPAAAPKGAA
jgi:hypothetical protein